MPPTNTPQPWASAGRWIPDATPQLQKAIYFRAMVDDDIGEHPPGSNRSTTIDLCLRRSGVDEHEIESGNGYWCAAWAGCVAIDAGAAVPPAFFNCNNWYNWAVAKGLWTPAAQVPALAQRITSLVGHFALFGANNDPSHIGIITRYDEYRRFISGNTSSNGLSNNGTLVTKHDLPDPPRFMGTIRPIAAGA